MKTCQSCYLHLRDISSIRDSLTAEAAAQLIHSLVTSRLDYCNSLLTGCTQQIITKLQRVQNMAARIVVGRQSRSFESSRSLLQHLHWLPVAERIRYKVSIMTFKALNDLAPPYISNMVQMYEPPQNQPLLRSANQNRLALPNTSPRAISADRTFDDAAPKIWNILPLRCRTADTLGAFKKNIKTEFYVNCFN